MPAVTYKNIIKLLIGNPKVENPQKRVEDLTDPEDPAKSRAASGSARKGAAVPEKRYFQNSFAKGFTMIELIVGALIFGILSLILLSILTNGMHAVDRGKVAAQARENARQALDRMTSELRQGVPISYQQNGRIISSAVFLPNPYSLCGNSVIQKDADCSNTYIRPQGSNIIIFSQVIDSSSTDTKDLKQYRYVVYRAQANKLERLIYNVTDMTGTLQGLTLDTSGRWLPDSNFFNTTRPQEQGSLVELPRTEDLIKFTFTHRDVSNTQSMQYDFDAGKVLLDPLLYTLTITATQYDLNELKKNLTERNPIKIDLTSAVRVEGMSN